MTEAELRAARTLSSCRFAPATFDRRFARDVAAFPAEAVLTPKQRACLWRLVHRYRRQLPAGVVRMARGGKGPDMTDQEWLASNYPGLMVEFARKSGRASRRTLRLAACGCARLVWHLLGDARSRRAVVEMEAEVDGEPVSCGFMARAGDVSSDFQRRHDVLSSIGEDMTLAERARWNAADVVSILSDDISPDWPASGNFLSTVKRALLLEKWADPPGNFDGRLPEAASVIRCVFGNPFQPRPPLPDAIRHWQHGLPSNLAAAIYTERAWDRLPILADLLEEAGCADAAVLGHLRGPGPHCRGCWCVDLVLGKE